MFLFLIDYAARLLRPVSILARVGDQGIEVLYAVYPSLASADHDEPGRTRGQLPAAAREVRHTGRAKTLLAVDLASLIEEARRHDGVIELVPQVGDFVARGGRAAFPILRGERGSAGRPRRPCVARRRATEGTMEQDPALAFRIMVDVA